MWAAKKVKQTVKAAQQISSRPLKESRGVFVRLFLELKIVGLASSLL